MDLVEDIYRITSNFPPEERFGLTAQMRRCAVSIPSNVAEGSRRNSRKDYAYFVSIAFGSTAELETQLDVALRLQFGASQQFEKSRQLVDDVSKMLNKLRQSLLDG